MPINELSWSIFGSLIDLLGAGLQTLHDWGASPWLAIGLMTIVVRTLLFPLTGSRFGACNGFKN